MTPLDRRLPAWHVAFIDTDCRIWWHRFLRPGFRHCFVFAPDGRNRWVLLDPLFDGAHIRIVDDPFIAGLVAEVRARRGTIIIARVEEVQAPLRPQLLLTCVSVIIAILASPIRALTPYGLARRLMARGALCAPGFTFGGRRDEPDGRLQAEGRRRGGSGAGEG